ncbi:MAG: alginate export family protein [Acidobacteriota bacterium]|nr:alginate export family protein [Acidobacteriota bacterium]
MFFVLFVVSFVSVARAQDAPKVTATLSNATRIESWSYFRPRIDPLALTAEPIGEPTYTFVADRAELGVRVEGPRFDLSGAFNYVRLENLPSNAIGPGGLGAGAFYFAAAGVRYSYQLYLSELTLRLKTRDDRLSAAIGRMHYASGGEHVATFPSLETVKRERLHSRLIGDFEWSLYQRRFDGVRVDVDRPAWRFTSSAFLATQGGYEESANLSMPKVQVAGMVLTKKSSAPREWQAFAHLYRDRRASAAVVDNTFSLDRPVDVTIAAIGGSHARVVTTGAGELDTVVWAAGELGDWYGQTHRAASAAGELGHRWTRAPMRPWLRAGYLYASGDGDPNDDRHGTFFQMLPSSRKYALSSAYAQMNLRDVFVQVLAEPGRVKTRLDLHRVSLASGADRWYQGSGATSSTGRFFGFSGRAAGGATALGTVLEGTIEVPIKKYWSLNAYAATIRGGAVVERMFAATTLTTGYVENVIRF